MRMKLNIIEVQTTLNESHIVKSVTLSKWVRLPPYQCIKQFVYKNIRTGTKPLL